MLLNKHGFFLIDYNSWSRFLFSRLCFSGLGKFVESPEAHSWRLAFNCGQKVKTAGGQTPSYSSLNICNNQWSELEILGNIAISLLHLGALGHNVVSLAKNMAIKLPVLSLWNTTAGAELVNVLPYLPGFISKWVGSTKALVLVSVVQVWVLNESIWSILCFLYQFKPLL